MPSLQDIDAQPLYDTERHHTPYTALGAHGQIWWKFLEPDPSIPLGGGVAQSYHGQELEVKGDSQDAEWMSRFVNFDPDPSASEERSNAIQQTSQASAAVISNTASQADGSAYAYSQNSKQSQTYIDPHQ